LLGAGAGMAGCSRPVQSLLVPAATAADVRAPHSASVESLGLAQVQVNTIVNMQLVPRAKGYWRAVTSVKGAVEILDKRLDEESILYAKLLEMRKVSITLIGRGGETFGVDIN
jgi:hypothetical protein